MTNHTQDHLNGEATRLMMKNRQIAELLESASARFFAAKNMNYTLKDRQTQLSYAMDYFLKAKNLSLSIDKEMLDLSASITVECFEGIKDVLNVITEEHKNKMEKIK